MKKFFMFALLVSTALFVFSCISDDDEKEMIDEGLTDTTPGGYTDGDTDSGSDTLPETAENDPDTTDTASEPGESDSDTSDTATQDNDTTDSTGDADTTSEQPDTSATDDDPSDSGDTAPDNDNAPQTDLPECGKGTTFPCEDPSNHWIWSDKTASTSNWNEGKNHCESMGSGWELPSIDDLRTLVLNCTETAPNGSCNVKEGCLNDSSDCYTATDCVSKNCPTKTDGSYSKLGDTGYLWSSSEMEGNSNRAWYLNFKFAAIGSSDKSATDLAYTRCVKK